MKLPIDSSRLRTTINLNGALSASKLMGALSLRNLLKEPENLNEFQKVHAPFEKMCGESLRTIGLAHRSDFFKLNNYNYRKICSIFSISSSIICLTSNECPESGRLCPNKYGSGKLERAKRHSSGGTRRVAFDL